MITDSITGLSNRGYDTDARLDAIFYFIEFLLSNNPELAAVFLIVDDDD